MRRPPLIAPSRPQQSLDAVADPLYRGSATRNREPAATGGRPTQLVKRSLGAEHGASRPREKPGLDEQR
jgi:hypothetical protein